MRPINTVSILIYSYPTIKYYSYRCGIILLNGLLYHGVFPESTNMCIIDLFFNFLIFLYTGYYIPNHLPIALVSIVLWILNDTLLYTKYINSSISEVIHTITVHIPMVILLSIHLQQEIMVANG